MEGAAVLADCITITASLLRRLRELGVPLDAVMGRAGLGAARFEAAHSGFTTEEFFAFWRAIDDERSVSRELGLVLGSQAIDGGYSVACSAALHAATLADALASLARYKQLTCPEQVELEVAGGEASVRFHWVLAGASVPRLLVDSTFASFVALARRGTGSLVSPRRIELARARGDVRSLAAHFGCELVFGAPVDRLVFDARALALPFVTHDAEALAALVPGLEAELIGPSHQRSMRNDVRVAIARTIASGARPSVEAIARRLRLSSRTLQRRLGEEATSYQEQLDDVRQKTAQRLLENTELDTVEVAFLLGFEEPNSFVRAFRGWAGTTPLRFRGRLELGA
jgi:AraC-like DNA-binding protein